MKKVLVNKEEIRKAKEKLGVDNAYWMAEILDLQQFDERNLKSLCPFHSEDTPSFIYDKKRFAWHCFGVCGRSYDIIDVLMMKLGYTYMQAVQALFEKAGVEFSLGEVGVRTKAQYRYPEPMYADNKEATYAYMESRGISKETVDYLNIGQDTKGNMLFQYYDTNDVLTVCKVRPSRRVEKSEKTPKIWYLKDGDGVPFDHAQILYNMNKVNADAPLLITSGESDCAAAIESGWSNAVSIPGGDSNTQWVGECWDWLEQFDEVIICPDNDKSGAKYCKEIVPRLGSWRCRVASVPQEVEYNGKKRLVNDLNELLFFAGKEAVMKTIVQAEATPVPSVIGFSDINAVDISEMDGVHTGFSGIDRDLHKLFYGSFNVVSGYPGCVDCETEFFTGKGWKRIADYQPGDKVLQYNVDGTATLVEPEKFHKYPCDTFYSLKTHTGIDQMLSIEHNLVYITSKGNLAKKPLYEVIEQHKRSKQGFCGKIPVTFQAASSGVNITDQEIRIMCAVIADGSFQQESVTAKTYGRVRINIKRRDKQERLRKLLSDAHIDWNEKRWNKKDSEYINFLFTPPIRTKTFPLDWYSFSVHQFSIVVDEVKYWDGRLTKHGSTQFYSTIKENADFGQFAMTATGHKASISVDDRRGEQTRGYVRKSICYTVSCAKGSKILGLHSDAKGKPSITPTHASDGFKYCFTVPSGMLVLRRNNCINITGNSGKTSFLYSLICNIIDQDVSSWVFSRELPEWMSKNWMLHMLAGRRWHNEKDGASGDTFYSVPKGIQDEISSYYDGKLYFYKDDYPNDTENIMTSMVDSARRYGCKFFLLDNLMTISLGGSDENKNERQTKFINDLISFATKYQVVVVLVCHPNKQSDVMQNVSMYQISGTSNIINLAHRAFGLRRVTKREKEGYTEGRKEHPPVYYDVVISIIKDRFGGRNQAEYCMYYDEIDRRFYSNNEEYGRDYGWDSRTYKNKPTSEKLAKIADMEDEVFGTVRG